MQWLVLFQLCKAGQELVEGLYCGEEVGQHQSSAVGRGRGGRGVSLWSFRGEVPELFHLSEAGLQSEDGLQSGGGGGRLRIVARAVPCFEACPLPLGSISLAGDGVDPEKVKGFGVCTVV